MHVGQHLVDRLIAYGIRRVFGVPGGQTVPLYHGVAHRQDQIEHVLMRDERSAVYAADAYARSSGRIAVCDGTVGPGASNLVSGLLEAYNSSIPVLAIVPDIPRRWEHRRHLGSASQGFEQRAFLEPCVKWYGRVEVPENLNDVLHTCIRVATSNRPGPVVLEIPEDVFSGPASATDFPIDESLSRYPRFRTAPDPDTVSHAAAEIVQSKKPVILAGGGAQVSGAAEAIVELAERLDAPVATTLSGKGIIAETHPLAIGISGSFGVPAVNDLLAETDCAVFVGTKAGQGATMGWTLPKQETTVVHVDVDADEIGRNFPNTIGLHADARLGLRALLDAVGKNTQSSWDHERIAEIKDNWWKGDIDYKQPPEEDAVKPQDVTHALREVMGDEDILVTDASLASGWGASRWQVRKAGRVFFAPRGLAGLGWGLPAATGVAFAQRDAGGSGRVICLAGDGGWAYSLAEIETLARFELPVVSVVLNNSILGWNKHTALNRYPDKMVSQDFTEVDFAAAARALGADAQRVETLEDFRDAIERTMGSSDSCPSVVEVLSSPTETPVLKSMSGSVEAVDSAY